MRTPAQMSSFFGLILILVFTGFTWPWDAPQQSKQAQPKAEEDQQQPAAGSSGVLSAEREVTIVPAQVPVQKAAVTVPAASKAAVPPQVPAKTAVTAGAANAASANPGDPQVTAVRSQLESMMRVNETLKNRYGQQAAEVQRITEQARIHQRILTELTATPAQPAYSTGDTQELLRQEKIRLIREQTERNSQVLESLNRSRSLPQ